jgi:hypothetical protein
MDKSGMDKSGMKDKVLVQRKKSKPNGLYERAATIEGGSPSALVLLLTRLFPAAFASQRFLHALFLAGFQVVGVSFYFLDDVLLLDLALEPAQSVLERLTFLQTNICQIEYTPQPA